MDKNFFEYFNLFLEQLVNINIDFLELEKLETGVLEEFSGQLVEYLKYCDSVDEIEFIENFINLIETFFINLALVKKTSIDEFKDLYLVAIKELNNLPKLEIIYCKLLLIKHAFLDGKFSNKISTKIFNFLADLVTDWENFIENFFKENKLEFLEKINSIDKDFHFLISKKFQKAQIFIKKIVKKDNSLERAIKLDFSNIKKILELQNFFAYVVGTFIQDKLGDNLIYEIEEKIDFNPQDFFRNFEKFLFLIKENNLILKKYFELDQSTSKEIILPSTFIGTFTFIVLKLSLVLPIEITLGLSFISSVIAGFISKDQLLNKKLNQDFLKRIEGLQSLKKLENLTKEDK